MHNMDTIYIINSFDDGSLKMAFPDRESAEVYMEKMKIRGHILPCKFSFQQQSEILNTKVVYHIIRKTDGSMSVFSVYDDYICNIFNKEHRSISILDYGDGKFSCWVYASCAEDAMDMVDEFFLKNCIGRQTY